MNKYKQLVLNLRAQAAYKTQFSLQAATAIEHLISRLDGLETALDEKITWDLVAERMRSTEFDPDDCCLGDVLVHARKMIRTGLIKYARESINE